MSEPVATKMISTTAVAILAELLGADLQIVIAALAGTILGDVFARPASMRYSVLRFCASTVAASVIGATIGLPYSRVAALGSGVVMHLALAWVGRRFDVVADSAARRAGVEIEGSGQ